MSWNPPPGAPSQFGQPRPNIYVMSSKFIDSLIFFVFNRKKFLKHFLLILTLQPPQRPGYQASPYAPRPVQNQPFVPGQAPFAPQPVRSTFIYYIYSFSLYKKLNSFIF